MFSKISTLTPLALALGLFGAGAQAQSSTDSMFTFSGFGTLGVVKTDTDEARYVLPGQLRGASKTASGEVDSKLGLQLGARFNAMFSATGQVLVKQTGDGDYKPGLEWAFVKAQVLPSLSIRAGRMGAPFFAVSDFRDVGYANLWLRPPLDVYGQVPVSRLDGADLNYQINAGPAAITLQLYGGKSDAVFEGVKVKLDKMVGFNASAEFDGGFTARVGHVQGKLTVQSESLDQLVGLLGKTPFASVGHEMDPKEKTSTFTGIGLGYDQGNVVAALEYTRRKTESYVPSTTGWFVSLGYRFGKFTPYLSFSELKQDSSNVNVTIPAGVAIPGVTPDLRALVNGTLESQSNRQKTSALGVRWDFYRNLAAKAQFERITPDGPGLFSATSAAFGSTPVNVYSLAVDFVF